MNTHLFLSLEEVFEGYYECRVHKRNTKSAIEFETNYEVNCFKLWKELNSMTYNIGVSIVFIVTKPKPREVFAADFRDRVVHHILMRRIGGFIENQFITDTYNCRKGKGTLYGINRLRDKILSKSENYSKLCYCLCTDIRSFFMSLPKEEVFKCVDDKILTKNYSGDDLMWMRWLVKKIVMHSPQFHCDIHGETHLWKLLPKDKSLFTNDPRLGLPIGNLPSQIFANLYMSDIDHWGREVTQCGYCRYVDDMRFVHTDKELLLSIIPVLRNKLKCKKLSLHPYKVEVIEVRKGIPFVGAIIKPHRIYVRSRTIYNIRSAIHKYNIRRITKRKIESSMNSYMGILIHFNSYNIRKDILTRFKRPITTKIFKL